MYVLAHQFNSDQNPGAKFRNGILYTLIAVLIDLNVCDSAYYCGCMVSDKVLQYYNYDSSLGIICCCTKIL